MKLLHNPGAVLIPPLPALLKKALPSKVSLVNAFLFQLVNHLDLGGNGCVVRAWLPQGLVSLHPLITDQDVLHGIVQGVSHMELSCDIRRGHHDCERLFAAVHLSVEILPFQPLLVQTVLYVCRIIGFLQFLHNFFLLYLYTCPEK